MADLSFIKGNLYLLDLSWHLYRSYYAYKNFAVDINGYQRPTGHIYGLYSAVRMIKESDPTATVILCEDGVPVERTEIMSEECEVGYKEGREEADFNFYKDKPIIKAMLCYLDNVYWAYNEDKESDDLMYALAKQAEAMEDYHGDIYIYSGDNDLLQSIDDRIKVLRGRTATGWDIVNEERVVTDEKFTKKFHGVDTYHLPYFRAIVGDTSDRIPAIYPRFPRDVAYSIAMSYNTDGCHFVPTTTKESKWFDIFRANFEAYKRNYKLMKLSSEFDVNLTKPVVNKQALLKEAKKLELNSYINYIGG